MSRKVYEKEFKLNAIRLSEESGMIVRELEKEFGYRSMLYKSLEKRV